ncbi:MAG: serine hydrolase [Blastocatellales bacterium]
MNTRLIRNLFVTVLLLVVVKSVPAQQAPLQGFDDYAQQAMKAWEVPGMAVAVVKDDKVVFSKGYGVTRLGGNIAVNDQTQFAIGSSSKAFTSAAIAILVDEGKIKWDDPVTKHLPGFELYDAYASKEMTVRDLLSHRSGLERGDLLWYSGNYDRNEILRRVRFLKPSWSFRSRFGYQNIMYLAAGQLVQAVTGRSWDDFIRERFFKPLGMKTSSTSITALKSMENVATPHAKFDEKVQPVAWRNIDNIAPAGSINSNVLEMANWVRMQLADGSLGDQRLISSGSIKEMHKSQMVMAMEIPWTLLFPKAHFLNYGLGWFLHDHHGRKVVSHGGNIDGMSALVAMIPEEKLGVVVLTNLNGSELRSAITNRIFDSFLGVAPEDWSASMLKAFKTFEAQNKAAQKKQEDERVKDTRPTLALEKYAGTYENEMYGEVKVAVDGGRLVAAYGPSFVGDLEHWHYDTFRSVWRDKMLGKSNVQFLLDSQGKVAQVQLQNLGEFNRVPEKAPAAAAIALSEAEMARFAGKYTLPGAPFDISIEMVGGKLKAVVPGQPVYTLVPVAPARFQIEGAPAGFFAEFTVENGNVKNMILEQGPGPKMTLSPKK